MVRFPAQINLSFLYPIALPHSLDRLESHHMLRHTGFSDFYVQLIKALVKVILFIFVSAYLILVLETLGPLDFMERWVQQGEAEDWSFFNAVYFIFITFSTVGYGDITPTTSLARMAVMFFVLFGITRALFRRLTIRVVHLKQWIRPPARKPTEVFDPSHPHNSTAVDFAVAWTGHSWKRKN